MGRGFGIPRESWILTSGASSKDQIVYMTHRCCVAPCHVCRVAGPHYPNSTTNFNSQDPQWTGHCANGCLFNLRLDPLEANDLARSMQAKVWELRGKIAKYEASAFNVSIAAPPPKKESTARRVIGEWG